MTLKEVEVLWDEQGWFQWDAEREGRIHAAYTQWLQGERKRLAHCDDTSWSDSGRPVDDCETTTLGRLLMNETVGGRADNDHTGSSQAKPARPPTSLSTSQGAWRSGSWWQPSLLAADTAADTITFSRAGITVATLRTGVRVAAGRGGRTWIEPPACCSTAVPELASPAPVHRVESPTMPSLGTQFGPRVAGTATEISLLDLIPAEPPPIPPEKAVEMAAALLGGGFTSKARPEPAPVPEKPKSPYLTLQEAADYSRRARGTISNAISAGDLAKKAGSYMVLISPAELERWMNTKRPTRKQAEAAKRKQAEAARKPAKKKVNER